MTKLCRLLCLGSLAWLRAHAACTLPGPLVSTTWLADHLNDPGMVVLTVTEKSEYDASHIPGALFLNYPDIYEKRGALSMELPSMDRLAEVFGRLGITDDSCIVIAGFSDKWGLAPGARTYLTLDAMGLGRRTAILDGGYPQWRREERPVSTEVRAVVRGTLTPHPRNDVIADLEYVATHLRTSGVVVVDARPAAMYSGEPHEGERGGHIPGAYSLPRPDLVSSDGTLQPVATLRKLFSESGIKPSDRVVAYCHIGQQASVLYFAARLLGYDSRLYDGSWEEWNAHTELPVELRAAVKK